MQGTTRSKNMMMGPPMVMERWSVALGFFCARVSNSGGVGGIGSRCLPSSVKFALVSYSSSSSRLDTVGTVGFVGIVSFAGDAGICCISSLPLGSSVVATGTVTGAPEVDSISYFNTRSPIDQL